MFWFYLKCQGFENSQNTIEAVAKSSAGQANSAQIEELDSKVDLLSKLVSKTLGELDDHKENLSSIDDKKTLDFKDRLIECEKLILPLLQNLMKNEDKEYIYWPNRKAIIQQQIDRLQKSIDKLSESLYKHIEFIDKTYSGLKNPIEAARKWLRK